MEESSDKVIWEEEKLNVSRKEMTENLTLFFAHVKYTLTLMLSLFTASGAILGFGLKEIGSGSSIIQYLILTSSFILLVFSNMK